MPRLLSGMHVRVPDPELRQEWDNPRDHMLGKIVSVQREMVEVGIPRFDPERRGYQVVHVLYPVTRVQRCKILPFSRVHYLPGAEWTQVYYPVSETFTNGQLLHYYIQGKEGPLKVSEGTLMVPQNCQDPDPVEQLLHYEFHHPIWRSQRDIVVKQYADVRNSADGIEDLVASRVHLLRHQADAVARILSEEPCRFLLADEVGLGKTIQACVVLKALQQRVSGLKTLLLIPEALCHQWQSELRRRFWINCPILPDGLSPQARGPYTVIVPVEALVHESVHANVSTGEWDMLIVDEVHHLRKGQRLYPAVQQLARVTPRVLLLSATPIQSRRVEYYELMALLDPERYRAGAQAFRALQEAQSTLVSAIRYLAPTLNPEDFDPFEFEDEMAKLSPDIRNDPIVHGTLETFSNLSATEQLPLARELLYYLFENYRVEKRIIRHRRRYLKDVALPRRELGKPHDYLPESEEQDTLEALRTYLHLYTRHVPQQELSIAYVSLLLHAAAISPYALATLLEQRATSLARPLHKDRLPVNTPRTFLRYATAVMECAPRIPGEGSVLERLLWRTAQWQRATDFALMPSRGRFLNPAPDSPHRLLQALRALNNVLVKTDTPKVLIFSSWQSTLAKFRAVVAEQIGTWRIAEFHAGIAPDRLEEEASRFQRDTACQVLLCDELGGEGRNFQIADTIIHIDLPLSPSVLEQRLGRVDRLGRTGTVTSTVVYAQEQGDAGLFRLWNEGLGLFTESLSGMEIALGEIQEAVAQSLYGDSLRELAQLLPVMQARIQTLRRDIEIETLTEQALTDLRPIPRAVTQLETYRENPKFELALLGWARTAGLNPRRRGAIVEFPANSFSLTAMRKARLERLPNMEEALERSRSAHDRALRGTFRREVAMQREDINFFVPGHDPWTEMLFRSALQADRGRVSAIERFTPEGNWEGFEFNYRFELDPRPLCRLGISPEVLRRIRGYLPSSQRKLVINANGQFVPRDHWVHSVMRTGFTTGTDLHLGQRGNGTAQQFIREMPPDRWEALVKRVSEKVRSYVARTYHFNKAVDRVRQDLEREMASKVAHERWRLRRTHRQRASLDVRLEAKVIDALVAAVRDPVCVLESVGYWRLTQRERV